MSGQQKKKSVSHSQYASMKVIPRIGNMEQEPEPTYPASQEKNERVKKLPTSSTAAFWSGVNATHAAHPVEANVGINGIARFQRPFPGMPTRTMILPVNPQSQGMRHPEAIQTAITGSGAPGSHHFVFGETGGLDYMLPPPHTFQHAPFYTKPQQAAMKAERDLHQHHMHALGQMPPMSMHQAEQENADVETGVSGNGGDDIFNAEGIPWGMSSGYKGGAKQHKSKAKAKTKAKRKHQKKRAKQTKKHQR
jgi:hypothetical protein